MQTYIEIPWSLILELSHCDAFIFVDISNQTVWRSCHRQDASRTHSRTHLEQSERRGWKASLSSTPSFAFRTRCLAAGTRKCSDWIFGEVLELLTSMFIAVAHSRISGCKSWRSVESRGSRKASSGGFAGGTEAELILGERRYHTAS